MKPIVYAAVVAGLFGLPVSGIAQELCQNYGPQTPRDISATAGTNPQSFPFAPPASEMNLCNLHMHTNAEHKGPGFSVDAGQGGHGGWKCNETAELTEAELSNPGGDEGAFAAIVPGDTIEVHWVYSSCQVAPGKSLGACSSDQCANPTLRVEAQVFLVVNDDSAADFGDFAYDGYMANGLHQPRSLPTGTGEPVNFLGSTTGSSYTNAKCSPMQVTWSVRPNCTKVSYSSLEHWAAKGNVFKEDHSHEVRLLVTAPELLAPVR